MPVYDAAVIGAGPAGLMCARNAARRGLRTILVDGHDEPGAKLACAGGGKGNFTNRILDPGKYTGEDASGIVRSVLREFGCNEVLALLHELGLPWEERDFGQIFGLRPAWMAAERLAIQADDAGVDFLLGKKAGHFTRPALEKVQPSFGRSSGSKHLFSFTAGSEQILAKSLVLATGSKAAPQLGADDSGLSLAAAWGHETTPFRPVLVPLTMPANWPLSGLEGISINVRLGIARNGTVLHPDSAGTRPLLFTHLGASGPAVLVLSCHVQPGDAVVFDFLPELPVAELLNARENGRLLARNVLSRHMPQRLADALCPEDLARRKTAELSKKDRLRLASAVHEFTAVPTGTEGFRRAEAAAGGVLLRSVTRNLESAIVPGLWFCGELLDVTGILGGYNIHWALASGARVGNCLPTASQGH